MRTYRMLFVKREQLDRIVDALGDIELYDGQGKKTAYVPAKYLSGAPEAAVLQVLSTLVSSFAGIYLAVYPNDLIIYSGDEKLAEPPHFPDEETR